MLKFWNFNLVDQPQTVITATNENALFPASNLKDPRKTKAFRSTTASTVVVFDFVTTEAVDSILLAPHTRNGWAINTPVTIEANATNTWGAPSFSTTLASGDLDQANAIAIKEFTAQSYRFWRLTFTGTIYAEVAKVFIGSALVIGAGRSMNYNWQYQSNDLSTVSLNRYGQRFADVVVDQKRIGMEFGYLSKDEVDDLLEVYDYNKTYRPFFMHVDCDILNENRRLSGLFYLESMPVLSNPVHALWNTALVLVEAN
jgi:hypothetical protein